MTVFTMGTHPWFSRHFVFQKETIFVTSCLLTSLLASLDEETLPNRNLLLHASLKSVPIYCTLPIYSFVITSYVHCATPVTCSCIQRNKCLRFVSDDTYDVQLSTSFLEILLVRISAFSKSTLPNPELEKKKSIRLIFLRNDKSSEEEIKREL